MCARTIEDRIREDLKDPAHHQGFAEAGEAWDLAIQMARIRRERGLTQAQLAEMVGTKQQNIARIENPAYSGHSLSLLRRIAHALGMVVRVQFLPSEQVLEEEGWGKKEEPGKATYPTPQTDAEPMLVKEDSPAD